MTVFAHIVDGAVISVGELPPVAIRQDTGQRVHPAEWLRACGYYNLETIDPADPEEWPDLTDEQRGDLQAAITDARSKLQRRNQLVTTLHALTDLALARNWEWLDQYCDPAVGRIPFVQAESPNAGAGWSALTTQQKAEAVRLGVSLALAEDVRLFQSARLFFDALSDLITAADVDTVPDR